MKFSGAGPVLILACVMITGLSILYWRDVGEQVISAGIVLDGQKLPMEKIETENNQIAITFDVAWSNLHMQEILQILEEHNVKATFFVTGSWVGKNAEITREIVEKGHELGNSGWSHQRLSELSDAACKDEIEKTHRQVEELTGYEMKLFRAPYDEQEGKVIRTATSCGYDPIGWGVDSQDWKNYGKEDVLKQIMENGMLESGAIIRFHSDSRYICESLPDVLRELKKRNYSLVTVSQLKEENNS